MNAPRLDLLASADAMALLNQLVADNAALRADVAEIRAMLEPKPKTSAPATRESDYEAMSRILPVIAEVFREPFLISEIVDHASMRDEVGKKLKRALGDLDGQRLGMLFRRTMGQPVAGFAIRRLPAVQGSARWQCGTRGT